MLSLDFMPPAFSRVAGWRIGNSVCLGGQFSLCLIIVFITVNHIHKICP